MELGGLQKTTLIDYPGRVACTVFTAGCNYKCPFCYNPALVLVGSPSARLANTYEDSSAQKQHHNLARASVVSKTAVLEHPKNARVFDTSSKTASTQLDSLEFFNFLKERKNQLEGVCICGGEPTIHADLPAFCKQIKELGFAVKLDTNGSNPEMLKRLIADELVDYVALDIKAPKDKYSLVAGIDVDVEKVEQSVAILKASGVTYELRTTVVPTLLSKADVVKIAEWIGPAEKYFLQSFQAKTGTVDPALAQIEPYSDAALGEMRDAVASSFRVCKIR